MSEWLYGFGQSLCLSGSKALSTNGFTSTLSSSRVSGLCNLSGPCCGVAVVGGGGHALLQDRRSPAIQGGSLSSMSGQGRKSHPLAGSSGWLSHPGCPSLSWVLGIVGQGTTLPIPPLLNNLRRRPLVSLQCQLLTGLTLDSSKLVKCYHLLLHRNIVFWEKTVPLHA